MISIGKYLEAHEAPIIFSDQNARDDEDCNRAIPSRTSYFLDVKIEEGNEVILPIHYVLSDKIINLIKKSVNKGSSTVKIPIWHPPLVETVTVGSLQTALTMIVNSLKRGLIRTAGIRSLPLEPFRFTEKKGGNLFYASPSLICNSTMNMLFGKFVRVLLSDDTSWLPVCKEIIYYINAAHLDDGDFLTTSIKNKILKNELLAGHHHYLAPSSAENNIKRSVQIGYYDNFIKQCEAPDYCLEVENNLSHKVLLENISDNCDLLGLF